MLASLPGRILKASSLSAFGSTVKHCLSTRTGATAYHASCAPQRNVFLRQQENEGDR